MTFLNFVFSILIMILILVAPIAEFHCHFHFHIVYGGWPFSIVLVSKGPSIYFTISLVLKN